MLSATALSDNMALSKLIIPRQDFANTELVDTAHKQWMCSHNSYRVLDRVLCLCAHEVLRSGL